MQLLLVACCLTALFALGTTKAVNGEVSFVCPTADGYFLDPEHCSHYYACHGGVPESKSCNKGAIYDPWMKSCGHANKHLSCHVYVHPEDHHIQHVYYIKDGDHTFPEGEARCQGVGLELVSIANWDEDTFIKDFTRFHEDHYNSRIRQTYWSSGYRTEFSSQLHRDFMWSATGEYIGYSDWCDAGLRLSGPMAPRYPPPCNPDIQENMCVQLNSSYIESYGWWDASSCSKNKLVICEHNAHQGPTDPPTPTPKPTTTANPTRVPTTALPDEEFLRWFSCFDMNKHGFCEIYFSCDPDENGNIIKSKVACSDVGEGYLFDNNKQTCVPPTEYPGAECDLPANACSATGIFHNRRNCGRFYSCIEQGDGSYLQKDYTCPDGWLYDDTDGTCIRWTEDPVGSSICPFDYQLPSPVEPEDSAQCTTEGRFAYDDPLFEAEDDFIHCEKQKDGSLGQLGPFYCPAGSAYRHGICELA